MSKPTIAVTMGDPAGIGPEIVVRALGEAAVREGDVHGALDAVLRVPLGLPVTDEGEAFHRGRVP